MHGRWVGIDCGYSQMTVAVVDVGAGVVALERTREPSGDGHSCGVALARLHTLLGRLRGARHEPASLAGYCYTHSGVVEAFREAGWSIEGCMALNDVVGFYGLTEMRGNALVGGCGSFDQVVYVSHDNNVQWPGDDLSAELPRWLLSGREYAAFLVDLAGRDAESRVAWLAQAVSDTLGGQNLESSDGRWGQLGPLLTKLLDHPAVGHFIADAADSVAQTRLVFQRHLGLSEPPAVILGGGAVSDEGLCSMLSAELESRGTVVTLARGEPAIGLARFALRNPGADAWSYVGREKPSWLS